MIFYDFCMFDVFFILEIVMEFYYVVIFWKIILFIYIDFVFFIGNYLLKKYNSYRYIYLIIVKDIWVYLFVVF